MRRRTEAILLLCSLVYFATWFGVVVRRLQLKSLPITLDYVRQESEALSMSPEPFLISAGIAIGLLVFVVRAGDKLTKFEKVAFHLLVFFSFSSFMYWMVMRH